MVQTDKGCKKDALDKRLLTNRQYEAVPGQTLQDFFATVTENMAYGDAVKAGEGTDPDRRAHHMLIRTASQMTRSITFTVSCTIPQRQLWTLVRYRQLHSGFTTSLGTWIDTEAGHRDSRASLCRYSQTSDVSSSSVPGLARVASRTSGRRDLSSRRWLRVQRLGRPFFHLATVSSR